jgi:hypothetical protein
MGSRAAIVPPDPTSRRLPGAAETAASTSLQSLVPPLQHWPKFRSCRDEISCDLYRITAIWSAPSWLQSQERLSLRLQRRRWGQLSHRRARRLGAEATGVRTPRRERGEERVEAVHRQPLLGLTLRLLPADGRRRRGRRDWVSARGAAPRCGPAVSPSAGRAGVRFPHGRHAHRAGGMPLTGPTVRRWLHAFVSEGEAQLN